MTAPFIFIYIFSQVGFQGISMKLSNHLQQVTVRVNEYGFVATLEKLPATFVAPVVPLDIDPV
jgi:hypothetical protein